MFIKNDMFNLFSKLNPDGTRMRLKKRTITMDEFPSDDGKAKCWDCGKTHKVDGDGQPLICTTCQDKVREGWKLEGKE